MDWILLIHQLLPKPTNLRVRIWRKLQKLGAAAIKNSLYVLPATEKTHEDFQWLKREIEQRAVRLRSAGPPAPSKAQQASCKVPASPSVRLLVLMRDK